METERYPKARVEALVVRELADEVLVYDLERHKAHCLNVTAAAVWRNCDGETEPAEIAFRLAKDFGEPVAEDVVWLALDQLSGLKLLETPVVRANGMSRAKLVKRAGMVAAVVALPTAASLLAPSAAMAVTCPNCATICCDGGDNTPCAPCDNCPTCPCTAGNRGFCGGGAGSCVPGAC